MRMWATPQNALPGTPHTPRSRFRPGAGVHRVLSRGVWQYPLLITLVLAVVTTTTLLWRYQPGAVDLKSGTIAEKTIKANRTVEYTSTLRTAGAKRIAMEDPTLLKYTQDPRIADVQVQKLDTFLVTVENLKRIAGISGEQFRALIAPNLPTGLPSYDVGALYALDTPALLRVGLSAKQTLRAGLTDRRIFPGTEAIAPFQITAVTTTEMLTGAETTVTLDLARAFVAPNMVEDVQASRDAQLRAAANVPDVKVTVLLNEALVREGDLVTAETVEKLEAVGLRTPTLSRERLAGLLGIVAALVGMLALFIWRSTPGRWRGSQALLLIFALAGAEIVARLLLPGHTILPFLFPVAGISMLLTLLINFEIAIAATIYLSLLVAYFSEQSLAVAVMMLVTGLVGIILAERAQSTSAFLWSGLILTVMGSVVTVSFGLVTPPVDLPGIATRIGFAALNAVLSTTLAFLGVAMLARLFGIVTPFQLLELGHPRQPLLTRLGQDAPGTYYHSMIVGNLAEKAVEAVGGDPLLTRTAVWYHDIGKALHPTYFIENQANIENVHDTLDPYVSARILVDHVRDGVAMAEEARLPQPIIDIVAQHHGTMRAEYFYRKAKERDGDTVNERDFRYPGPIPQTREAAIVMLADATEAATRAANRAGKLNPAAQTLHGDIETARTAAIRKIVENIVRERIADGQLADAPLTLRDISLVQRTFVNVLDGMYHPRVEYPEPE